MHPEKLFRKWDYEEDLMPYIEGFYSGKKLEEVENFKEKQYTFKYKMLEIL